MELLNELNTSEMGSPAMSPMEMQGMQSGSVEWANDLSRAVCIVWAPLGEYT